MLYFLEAMLNFLEAMLNFLDTMLYFLRLSIIPFRPAVSNRISSLATIVASGMPT
jgi:hypothetical protein